MTVPEALKLIDQALSSVQADRQTHQMLMEAQQTITDALEERDPEA